MVDMDHFPIIALSEMSLDSNYLDCELGLHDYNIHRHDRKFGRGELFFWQSIRILSLLEGWILNRIHWKFFSAKFNKGQGTLCCLELFIVHPVLIWISLFPFEIALTRSAGLGFPR